MTLYALASLEEKPAQPKWLGDGALDPSNPNDERGHIANYSKELKTLIKRCTAFAPGHRPTFPELLTAIDDAIERLNLTHGIRDSLKVNLEQTMSDDDKLALKGERYELGRTRPVL